MDSTKTYRSELSQTDPQSLIAIQDARKRLKRDSLRCDIFTEDTNGEVA